MRGCAWGVLLLSLLGWLPGAWWLELFVHFLPQYALIALLVGLRGLRDGWVVAPAALALLLNLAIVLPFYNKPGSPGPAAGRLIVCNVLKNNPAPSAVIRFLQQARPDVIVLQEVKPFWNEHLRPLLKDYPGQLLAIRADDYGMVLLSRQPLENTAVEGEIPILWADTRLGSQPLHVIATHPPPPVSSSHARERNQVIGRVGQLVADSPRPYAVMGDFNDTPWAPSFGALRDNVRVVRDSWPTFSPAGLRIPIDHCLLSEELNVTGYRTGPVVGSDHFPLVVDVSTRCEAENTY